MASVTSYDNTSGGAGHEVNEIKYTRDAWGNITASTQDPNGAAVVGTDPNVAYQWAYGLSGSAATYARLEKVTLPGGREIYYNYDSSTEFGALGRVANIAANGSPDADDKYVEYKYLGASMIVDANHPAVPGGLRLTYGSSGHYPGLDRFGRVVWQSWMRTGTTAADRYFYGYDRSGNRTWRAERSNAASAAGQRDEAYVYDGLDRLIGAKRGILPYKPYQAPHPGDATKDGAVGPADSALVNGNWDPAGENQNTWTMGDLDGDGMIGSIDRLIVNSNWATLGVTESVARSWSWTLRPTGNWSSFTSGGVEQTRTHNNANEITAITRSPSDLPDPLYGPAGCNVFGPKPNDDANGMHQRYDPWNRLATVHWDDGDDANTLDANDTLRATYRYDGLNRRVRKIVVGDDANTTTEHIYHNTGWQVLEIRRGTDGNTPAATAYKQYAYDIRYIDAPVCRWWDADTDGTMDANDGEMHYYTNDGNFNTTGLVDANSGSVVERYMYDPYGRPIILNGPADADPNTTDWTPDGDNRSDHENEILYCGYRYDPETGKYHLRNRYLDWLTGRLDSRDKSGYVDGPSLYEYVRSTPTDCIDWNGAATQSTAKPATDPVETGWPKDLAEPGRSKRTKLTQATQWVSQRYTGRLDRRPCFNSRLNIQGRAQRNSRNKGHIDIMAYWQLFVYNPKWTDDCFCCPDGSKGKIHLKQYLRRANYDSRSKKWDSYSAPRLDHKVPSPKDEKETKRAIVGRMESAGPFDNRRDGGSHSFPDWRAVGDEWQSNEVQYNSKTAAAQDLVVSWYDAPGFTFAPSGQKEDFDEGDGVDWWFYVEIWRSCGEAGGSAIIDRAQFQIGLQIRSTGKKKMPAKAELRIGGATWLKQK